MRQEILEQMNNFLAPMDREELQEVASVLRAYFDQDDLEKRKAFRIGSYCKWEAKGRRFAGRVEGFNPKTMKVRASFGELWHIHFAGATLITKEEHDTYRVKRI